MTYDEIVQGLRDSTYELQNELRLVSSGLESRQDTVAIGARYRWLYSDEALGVVARPADEAQRRVRCAVLRGICRVRTARLLDRLATFFARATVPVLDRQVPFRAAQARLGAEHDALRREALADGLGAVMAEAEELYLELDCSLETVIHELGYDGYTGFFSSLKEIDYRPVREEVNRIADAVHGLYRVWVEPRMRSAGRAFDHCPQAHYQFFRGLRDHDAAFKRELFEPAMRRTFERLGLDLFSMSAIHIDLVDRPAKSPRASAWSLEAGREVHLLMRPVGGSSDYSAFLHEAGHALHFGLSDPAIGWPLANVGRSMAYAELWSFLVEHIGHDPVWIAEATGVGEVEAERIAADLAGVDLMLFVRYAGKLDAELELYAGNPLDAGWGCQVYAERLGARTGFLQDPRAWHFDRDPGYYAADYLRAWLAEAAVERSLRERFGERWWASAEAGEWLRRQWRRGWEPEVEETVLELTGEAWSGDAYVERLRSRLSCV